ncbi:MAG: hypothetical protein JXC36_04405, partial [Candidatus Atribacteria bacterium]|nr:hypothetical protein [Candidatus Atribacteria bacterium]
TKDGKEGKVIEVNILSRYIIIETIEKEDNERIKNRLKISLEEWQNDHKEIKHDHQNEENGTTIGTENRIGGEE